jgi:uncharacterized protein (DUF58 family)
MSARMIVVLAGLSALWLFGLIGQMHSGEALMRYLALSLALVAIGVWRWRPQPAVRRRFRERRRPPQLRQFSLNRPAVSRSASGA